MGAWTRRLVGAELAVLACLGAGAGASCGSRTGLLPEEPGDGGFDAPGFMDAFDAPPDIPAIDVAVPDVPVHIVCPDAAATFIYVIGLSSALYSFDPSSYAFSRIGTLRCPDPGMPFSMAVDREGTAYVLYDPSGSLYRVSTKTAECFETRYDARRHNGLTFGMGFVADLADGGETLFVAEDRGAGSDVLATIDTRNFALSLIGRFEPTVKLAELTGTGLGHLYAFQPGRVAPGIAPFLYEIEPASAKVVGEDPLPGINGGNGWAFGFWGGYFYMFTGTGPGGSTVVHKFDPSTKTNTLVADLPTDTVVGAGVSTCAPVN